MACTVRCPRVDRASHTRGTPPAWAAANSSSGSAQIPRSSVRRSSSGRPTP